MARSWHQFDFPSNGIGVRNSNRKSNFLHLNRTYRIRYDLQWTMHCQEITIFLHYNRIMYENQAIFRLFHRLLCNRNSTLKKNNIAILSILQYKFPPLLPFRALNNKRFLIIAIEKWHFFKIAFPRDIHTPVHLFSIYL